MVKSKPLLAKPAVLFRGVQESCILNEAWKAGMSHRANLGKKKNQCFILRLLKDDCCWEHLNYAFHSQKLKTSSYLQDRQQLYLRENRALKQGDWIKGALCWTHSIYQTGITFLQEQKAEKQTNQQPHTHKTPSILPAWILLSKIIS